MPKYIFITGGVISSLGKGITTASIAQLLQSRGFKVTCVKCDAYVNIDAGTMNPTEHGEVFVTDDGVETDQDVGTYERFLNDDLSSANYLTTGQIYQKVIERERNLEYKGKCVEVALHLPQEIIRRLNSAALEQKAEIVLAEIGGTVGEYQNILFVEADRMLKRDFADDVINIHVSYLPIPKTVGEMKTKPAQNSIRTLNATGIQPEFLVARAEKMLDKKRIDKISVFGMIKPENVISNPDVHSIYEVPLVFDKQKFAEKILVSLKLKPRQRQIGKWRDLVKTIKQVKKSVKIGIVGKYFDTGDFVLEDSYISVIEAIKHAAWSQNFKPEIDWIDSQEFEANEPAFAKSSAYATSFAKATEAKKASADKSAGEQKNCSSKLKSYDGIIVPGGFGSRGIEGKIKVIEYLRKNKIPFLGLCYGMQMAVVEFCRNVLNLKGAHTTEINKKTRYPVIDILPEQKKNLRQKDYGATMRLGLYKCRLAPQTKAFKAYQGQTLKDFLIYERHRHRYEFNNKYRAQMEKAGLIVSGLNPERNLVEIVELRNHPFFVGTQFHPEFKSRALKPHPLFVEFIKTAKRFS